jgi:prophage antirepressor-like protein
MRYFTEAGMYKFLLQSRSLQAEAFQIFTYDLLKVERKRTVDSIQLSLKIAETRNRELQREKNMMRQGETKLMSLINDGRESIKKLQKEKGELRVVKDRLALAAHMRDCGRPWEKGE